MLHVTFKAPLGEKSFKATDLNRTFGGFCLFCLSKQKPPEVKMLMISHPNHAELRGRSQVLPMLGSSFPLTWLLVPCIISELEEHQIGSRKQSFGDLALVPPGGYLRSSNYNFASLFKI